MSASGGVAAGERGPHLSQSPLALTRPLRGPAHLPPERTARRSRWGGPASLPPPRGGGVSVAWVVSTAAGTSATSNWVSTTRLTTDGHANDPDLWVEMRQRVPDPIVLPDGGPAPLADLASARLPVLHARPPRRPRPRPEPRGRAPPHPASHGPSPCEPFHDHWRPPGGSARRLVCVPRPEKHLRRLSGPESLEYWT